MPFQSQFRYQFRYQFTVNSRLWFGSLIFILICLTGCAQGSQASDDEIYSDMQFSFADTRPPQEDMESPSTDMDVIPVDMDVIPVDMDVIPVDMEVLPVDMEVLPVDMEVLPVDMEVLPVDMEIPVDQCGDGQVQAPEDCDTAGMINLNCEYGQESCQVCNANCELVAGQTSYCGDGELHVNEACDTAGLVDLNCEYGQENCQVCNANCELVTGQTSYCGDGELQANEACDTAGLIELNCEYGQQSCQVCNANCELVDGQTAYCGDGEVSHGERCDQGAANSDLVDHGCRTDCHFDHRDALVPFLQESYIVQGVASSCEARPAHECTDERLYLSLYYKDADGNDASDSGFGDKNSMIVELNPATANFEMTRCWLLSGEIEDSHVGGLAFARSHSGSAYLYASGGSRVERYTVPTLLQEPALAPNQLNYGSLDACGLLGGANNLSWVVSASSFVSHVMIDQSDYLMVGQFCNGGSCIAQAYAYQLNLNDGTIQGGQADQTFKIRQKAQGIDVDGDLLYVSVSYGDNDSYIYKDSLSAARCANTNCEGAQVQSLGRVTVKGGVAGGEDLARVGKHLWSASESGSRHFQNRPLWEFPWSSYFPYIYDLPISNTFASNATSLNQAIRSRHSRDEVRLLSNHYASWWDRTERLWVLDVNGDGADDMLLGPNQGDGCWYLLEGSQGEQSGEFIDRGCVVQAYAGWWDNTDRIRVMDVNGDQRDDIVIGPYSVDGCWYVLQGTSTAQGADLNDRGCVVEYKDNWSSKAERIRPLDVNGDGADDIVIGPSSAGAWYILEGRVASVADFNAGRALSTVGTSYGGWWDNAERIKVLDANGDGRDDIVIGPYSVNGCWYLLQGSAAPSDFIDRGCVRQAYENWHENSERFWIADFNGDGRDDIVLGPSGANGNWYMLAGSGVTSASLRYEGTIHNNYENWSDNARRIRVMHPKANAPAAILVGPKGDLGEWQLLQGHSGSGFYDKQWAVDWREDWSVEDSTNKPERIHVMDLNGDGADDIVIGPSSNGNWYLLETQVGE